MSVLGKELEALRLPMRRCPTEDAGNGEVSASRPGPRRVSVIGQMGRREEVFEPFPDRNVVFAGDAF